MKLEIISREFYERSTVIVARELLGCYLIREYRGQLLIGMITETEAYQGADDPASHAYHGKTKRNFPMFGPCGMSYVYFTYGMHYCFNVVAKGAEQLAGAVLIRAIKPICNIEIMQQLRGSNVDKKTLTNGPAKLTQALAIDRLLNNIDLTEKGPLFISKNSLHDLTYQELYMNRGERKLIEITPRIGIRAGQHKLWRFVLKKGIVA